MQYASFWRRLGASLIDGVALFVIGWILQQILGRELGSLVQFLIGLGYFAYMESSASQATFGKQLLGIKVTNEAGGALTMQGALIRYVAKILSAVILLIGFLMQPFTAKKQALHDIIAHALVVKA